MRFMYEVLGVFEVFEIGRLSGFEVASFEGLGFGGFLFG